MNGMLSWIVLLPLLGFLANGISYLFWQVRGKKGRISAEWSGGLASAAIAGSFILGLLGFLEGGVLEQNAFQWMAVPGLAVDFTFRLDELSSLFVLVITGVGLLIHLYSIGYMHEDESPAKFFAYLNLFCSAMLILVLGGSLPVLFLGWEGVGLCSYLLIGYWYEDREKAQAGKKAFIVNRVGDLGFLLGMFVLFGLFGTLDFAGLRQAVETAQALPTAAVTAACLLLFLGCTGKSAQIPLFVWLPDAMAGPTPVSALIHAATMVTSGIYLITRLNFLFVLSPVALQVIAWTGALTALFAATIAVAQNDIKKVLAYSTVSQLGYMFLGCGVGAFTAGVFHVITHAFFKALLFLAAGSVIHGMHHEQDITKMGGLRSAMPRTFFVFGAGWIAIAGIPPLSGFFSKDEILWEAYGSVHGGVALWAVGAVTAILTAFYMTRLFVLTFMGKGRSDAAHHAHESPWIMVGPLVALAVLSTLGGVINLPHLQWLGHRFHELVKHPDLREGVSHSMEYVLMGVSTLGAILGVSLGWFAYRKVSAKSLSKSPALLANKWYVDEVYDAVVVRPLVAFSKSLWKVFDVGVIDRMVVGTGRVSARAGAALRVVQNGSLQVYAVTTVLGLLVSVGYLLYVMGR